LLFWSDSIKLFAGKLYLLLSHVTGTGMEEAPMQINKPLHSF
jgi:hypothetical protein